MTNKQTTFTRKAMACRSLIALIVLGTFAACGRGPASNQNNEGSRNQAAASNPNALDTEGRTALDRAAAGGDLSVVQSLLDGGADVNARGGSGITALMTASGMGHIEVAKTLIARGADVNARTPGNYTALMQAALTGQTDIIRILLEAGADASVIDAGGRTAAKYAEEKGHKEIVELLGGHAPRGGKNKGN